MVRVTDFVFGRVTLLVICFLLVLSAPALAQQTSGSISGIVNDNQGAVIPNAKVVLLNQLQGTTREMNTTADGTFVFTPLLPATYTVTVEHGGFKKFERRDIKLFANDRIEIADIVLQLGALTETVTVEASAVQLQTQTAERSGVITGLQTVNLALNGRNYLDLIKTVPGIVSTFDGQVAGPGGIGSISANGQRTAQNNLTLDGVDNMDTGSNGTQHTSLNIDAVAEFKVITNGQQAEFGRSSGAAINIITKSGTQEFHGAGYWFHRHEDLNANNWRSNQDGLSRQFYRYNYQGYNIGGPVYIPGKFNKNKDKLFFFWSQEWQEQLIPNATRYVTVPTAAERQGDFSLTHESDGRPVTIKDPQNNMAPFPGNKIPQNRWNADGVKILNFYPLPNVEGHNDYNYQSQVSSSYPRRQKMGRIDWNINDKWRAFFRVIRDNDDQIMPYGQWNGNYNIPWGPMHFGQPGVSAIANLTTIINPTLTNEFIFGPSRNHLDITPVDDAFSKAKAGITFKMPFPNADPLGLVPNFRFGGVPNEALLNRDGFNGTPFVNANTTFDFSDNLNKVFSGHTLKAGFYIQRSRKDQTAFTSVNGNIWFDARDAANPNDTNWAFSNALMGNFQRLQQSNIVRNGLYRYTNVEWYIQDNWRIRRDLTLDYGVRFYFIQPQYEAKLQTSSFNPALWDPSQAAILWQKTATGSRNPVTGELGPPAMVGALVSGVGKWENGAYDNGMARAGLDGYPRGLIDNRGIHYAPRFGFAWSPEFFKGGVFRLGGGVFYDRFQGNNVFDQLPNPPSTISPTFYYGNVSTVGAMPGVLSPGTVRGFSRDGHVPTTYNWNAGFQKELPWRVLLDLGYAGSVSRHLLYQRNYNFVPFGAAWLPANQDPTVASPKFDGTTSLPENFMRPYQGYGTVGIYQFGANSNYNSLQVAANRRLTAGLQFGMSYTWGHALGWTSGGGDNDTLHPLNARMANYSNLNFDRRHSMVFNFMYDTPEVGRSGNFLDNRIGRAVFNNWTVSGIGTFQSGGWNSFTWTTNESSLNARYTGSPTVGARPLIVGNPALAKGEQAVDKWFQTDGVILAPVRGSTGLDSGQNYLQGPGINNWDISVFKNFPFDKEKKRRIQIRCEMFNAWNHTQFNAIATQAVFDPLTGKITNLPPSRGGGTKFGFGSVTGARDPRKIQLAAKIYF